MITEENWDAQLAKLACGELSKEEQYELELQLAQNPEKKAAFQQLKKVLQTMESVPEFDSNEAFVKVQSRIQKKGRKISFYAQLKWVAALFIGGIFAFSLYYFYKPNSPQTYSSEAAANNFILPDSSKVFAGPYTEITYVEKAGKFREVRLKGNAFFQLKENNLPFILNINDLIITDIGTSFGVEQDSTGKLIKFTVESGCIEVKSQKEKILLKAGESISFSNTHKTFGKIKKEDESRPDFARTNFTFINTSLAAVIQQLNQAYGSKIMLAKPELGNCTISVSFKMESLSLMLDVICETLNLSANYEKDKIILSGNACE